MKYYFKKELCKFMINEKRTSLDEKILSKICGGESVFEKLADGSYRATVYEELTGKIICSFTTKDFQIFKRHALSIWSTDAITKYNVKPDESGKYLISNTDTTIHMGVSLKPWEQIELQSAIESVIKFK